ncbi:hypothetical protein H0H81_012370 [Sphagnurus paluster]|uniref:Uncharacterized protein n=1 Tax=Sphagnurus paluster TaxID=117069 RepID=A0A9P7GIM4_9AGAR|nr:hypothetical protein H0H81_012370 [Sphagnurus paluster]
MEGNTPGEYATDTIYDNRSDSVDALISPSHRDVVAELLNADKKAGYSSYSLQIHTLIKASLARGAAGMVGHGKNVWSNVHINDLGNLYNVLYDAIQVNPATPHGSKGFYFAENDKHNMCDIALSIGKATVSLGEAKSPEPTTFT